MKRLWRLMAVYNAETTTFTKCAGIGGVGVSPYKADFDGRLVGLRAVPSAGAAAALLEHVNFKLSCTTFVPNVIECGCQGSGLHTAPAFSPTPMEWPVDQRVLASIPITIEGQNVTAETPVTVEVILYGLFELGG
jgi:hypothetical protein